MLAHAIQVVLFFMYQLPEMGNIKEIILKENITTNNDKYEKAIDALVEKEVSQPLSPIQRVAAKLWLKNNDIIETIKSVLRVFRYDDNRLKKMTEWELKKTLLEEIAQGCHYKFFTSPLGLWSLSDLKKRIGWIEAEELKGEIAQLNLRNPIIHHADMKSTFVYNKKRGVIHKKEILETLSRMTKLHILLQAISRYTRQISSIANFSISLETTVDKKIFILVFLPFICGFLSWKHNESRGSLRAGWEASIINQAVGKRIDDRIEVFEKYIKEYGAKYRGEPIEERTVVFDGTYSELCTKLREGYEETEQ